MENTDREIEIQALACEHLDEIVDLCCKNIDKLNSNMEFTYYRNVLMTRVEIIMCLKHNVKD